MSKHEDSCDRLDTEFDHFLLDMKPYVLKHHNKTGETCPLWLNNTLVPGSGFLYYYKQVNATRKSLTR